MQSNNLKRHSKIHKDIMSMNADEVRKELQPRHAINLEREERRQKIEEIAYKEEIPLPQGIIETSFNDNEDLEEDLLKDNQLYLERIELGKKISIILDQGVISEESLRKERNVALKLYRKQRPRFDIVKRNLRS